MVAFDAIVLSTGYMKLIRSPTNLPLMMYLQMHQIETLKGLVAAQFCPHPS